MPIPAWIEAWLQQEGEVLQYTPEGEAGDETVGDGVWETMPDGVRWRLAWREGVEVTPEVEAWLAQAQAQISRGLWEGEGTGGAVGE